MSRWRALGTGASPPASVAEVVLGVRSTIRLTRALECVLFFAAAVLLTRAAALVSGLEGAALPAVWALAAVCGALCAAAWWLEHPHGARATARALDERLRHDGALVTAFELETRTGRGPTPMEALVSAHVLARLCAREALRALVPPLVLPLAAPTLAALALLVANDALRTPPPRELDYVALADGLERALAPGPLDETSELTHERAAELELVLQARAALPASAEAWREDPAAARAAVEELDGRLASLAQEVEPESELRDRLEQARVWLDALRMGLAQGSPGAGAAGSEATGLTNASADGTIWRSPQPAAVPPTPPDPMAASDLPQDPDPATVGLQEGNWWPAEYDAVVARWLALSEAAGR